MNDILNDIERDRKTEKAMKEKFDADKKKEWLSRSAEIRHRIGESARKATAMGIKKSEVLRALGTKDFNTLTRYLETLEVPREDGTPDVIVENRADGLAEIFLNRYVMGSDVYSGKVVFQKDQDGDWVPLESDEIHSAVDNELFFSDNTGTELQQEWRNTVAPL